MILEADWAQASSDWAKALTVIVPSLCTLAVALLVARWNRSHDFEKERRRRKQDAIEKISDGFDLAANGYIEFLSDCGSFYHTHTSGEFVSEAVNASMLNRLNEGMDGIANAGRELRKAIGRLALLRLDHARVAMTEFHTVVLEMVRLVKLGEVDKYAENEREIQAKFVSFHQCRNKVIDELADALAAL